MESVTEPSEASIVAEVGVRAAAVGDARQDLGELHRAALARRALPARLDGEEAGQLGSDGDHVGGVVVDDESGGPEPAAERPRRSRR